MDGIFIAFLLHYKQQKFTWLNNKKWPLLQLQKSFHLHNFHLNWKKMMQINMRSWWLVSIITRYKNRQLRSMNSVKNCPLNKNSSFYADFFPFQVTPLFSWPSKCKIIGFWSKIIFCGMDPSINYVDRQGGGLIQYQWSKFVNKGEMGKK